MVLSKVLAFRGLLIPGTHCSDVSLASRGESSQVLAHSFQLKPWRSQALAPCSAAACLVFPSVKWRPPPIVLWGLMEVIAGPTSGPQCGTAPLNPTVKPLGTQRMCTLDSGIPGVWVSGFRELGRGWIPAQQPGSDRLAGSASSRTGL